MKDLLSIHKTAERCKAEGIPLAEHAIRRFVKTGDLPAVQTGRRALVYFPNVIEFVKNGNNQQDEPTEIGNIHRLPERMA